MSFIVSNGFNLDETIDRLRLLKWFHFAALVAAETCLNEQPTAASSTVSVVPLLIHSVNETEKVFGRCLKGCVHIVIAPQDYTKQPAARRIQPL